MTQTGYLVTRFAPSPTGHLHVGGARTALFCWAFAKSQRDSQGRPGRFMVRIEDTDAARSSDESARGILEDLAWLGIEWDDGPELKRADGSGEVIGGDLRGVGTYFQARRVALYNEQVERLVKAGRAYPAFESNEEIETQRKAAMAAKQTYRYPRPADVERGTFNAALEARWKRALAGERHVIRFAAPREEIVVHDQVLGDVKYAPGEMDDFVIRKADGFPTYHFAVVVDDELMGVTHVLRAQEHLNNTPRHVALQRALGFRTPVYGHMPIIMNMEGTKMSKRDKAKAARKAAKDAMSKDSTLTVATLAGETGLDAMRLGEFLAADSDDVGIASAVAARFKVPLPEIEVSDFRASGYVPEAMVNFLALLGWSPGMKDAQGKDVEKFDTAFLAKNFSVDRVGKGNSKFDRVKLAAFNQDYLKALSDDDFARRWREWCGEFAPEMLQKLDMARFAALAAAMKARCRTFAEARDGARWAVVADDGFDYDPKAVEKVLKKGEPSGLSLLGEIRPVLAGVEPFTAAATQAAIDVFCAARSVGIGSVAQPLRVALTGTTVSPPLGDTLAVLGRESVLRRIDRCLRTHSA
jgi:glutamyl-tRNA synthetase